MRFFRTSFVLVLSILSAALTAHAANVTWTLNGVTSLGTTFTGSFVYNADTETFSSVNVTTAGGSVIPSKTWTVAFNNGFPYAVIFVDTSAPNRFGANFLELGLTP